MADVRGRPLIRYAADALLGLHLDERFAVVSSDDVQSALPDFEPVVVDPADNQQSDSLKAGLNAAQDHAADRVLLVLGDMPLVTPQILRDVLALAGFDRASAVTDGARRMPPACFPVSMFPNLLAMQGDRGAAPILRTLPDSQLLTVRRAVLHDVDRPEDLTTSNLSGLS